MSAHRRGSAPASLLRRHPVAAAGAACERRRGRVIGARRVGLSGGGGADAHPDRACDAIRRAISAARGLLLAYLPGSAPIWLGGEARGERRVDAFLAPDPPCTQPRPLASLIDDAWTPTVSSLVAATPEDFRRGYLAYWAAWDDDPRARLGTRGILRARHAGGEGRDGRGILEGDVPERTLGCLAAGPVEDLTGHDLLDYVTSSAERRGRRVPLLRGTYWHNEPPAVRERMRALLGGEERSHRAESPRGQR